MIKEASERISYMNVQEVVKKYFGYDSLREGQQELVEGILSGKAR